MNRAIFSISISRLQALVEKAQVARAARDIAHEEVTRRRRDEDDIQLVLDRATRGSDVSQTNADLYRARRERAEASERFRNAAQQSNETGRLSQRCLEYVEEKLGGADKLPAFLRDEFNR